MLRPARVSSDFKHSLWFEHLDSCLVVQYSYCMVSRYDEQLDPSYLPMYTVEDLLQVKTRWMKKPYCLSCNYNRKSSCDTELQTHVLFGCIIAEQIYL